MAFRALLCLAALAAAAGLDPSVPIPALDDAVAPPAQPVIGFLSATLGDHMVLQRAPASAVVWGNTQPGSTVTTTFDGKVYMSIADSDGWWRQKLPPMLASMDSYNLTFLSSNGQNGTLNDVLFGDVYICGGQSNMQFSMGSVTNVSTERQMANAYPNIRLFTVGQGTKSDLPLGDLQTIVQEWAVASNKTIVGGDYFSAVCWFFGRQISDALSPAHEVPIGLISNNWGGTAVELWSTPGAFKACNRTEASGSLYNAMIHPYTVGPMAVSGFTWYQGEANTRDDKSASDYACLFPAMISEWRKAFDNPSAYFGFVQLSTWCGDPEGIAAMRDAQLAALALPKVGYATNADHGAGCNIHPPYKQYCGERLGNSALALQYGRDVAWKSPSFASAAVNASIAWVSVIIRLQDVSGAGLTTDVYPYNYISDVNCTALNAKTPGTCGWAAVKLADKGWLNATVSVAPGGQGLMLNTTCIKCYGPVIGTQYAWGAIPLMSAYDRGTGLPVLPWNRTLESAASTHAVFV